MNEAAVIAGIKSGAFAAMFAYFMTDTSDIIAMLVGLIGGSAGYYRELKHLEIPTTFTKALSEFFVTIPMAVLMALAISEIGNKYYPMKFGWLVVAFLVAVNPQLVMKAFTLLFQSATGWAAKKIDKKG